MSISARLISASVSAALLASAAPANAAPHAMSCTAQPVTARGLSGPNEATGNITVNIMIDLKGGGIRVDSVRGTSAVMVGWHPITEREFSGPKTMTTWTAPNGQKGANQLHYLVDNGGIIIMAAMARRECGTNGGKCTGTTGFKREYYQGMCRSLD